MTQKNPDIIIVLMGDPLCKGMVLRDLSEDHAYADTTERCKAENARTHSESVFGENFYTY